MSALVSLRFALRTRIEAWRVRSAGFGAAATKSAEQVLSRASFTARGIVSLSGAMQALKYRSIAGDARTRGASAWLLVFVPILILVDGYALGYTLAEVAAVDASEDSLQLFSSAAGVIGAGLLAFGMHTAGRHARWYYASRAVKREIILSGAKLPEADVSLFDDQDIDQALSPAARRWARMERTASLWPVSACVLCMVLVGLAVSQLRLEELLLLRAADTTGLPGDISFMTGIAVLFVFFIALQLTVFWMSYHNAWLGRESRHAHRVLLDGRLGTERDVAQHNCDALEFAERVHARFHQHLQRFNLNSGREPVAPVIYPSEVLAQMLQERAGMESLPNRNTKN